MARWVSVALTAAALVAVAAAQSTYRKPPREILDVMRAAAPPSASLSPRRDRLLVFEVARYAELSEAARPMLRLAGLRIDPANNGPHVPPRLSDWRLVSVADGTSRPVAMPPGMDAGWPIWSPDGKQFAFTNTTASAVELWIGDAATGQTHRAGDVAVNPVLESGYGAARGGAVVWMPDSRRLLCRLVPADRGGPPAAPAVMRGPIVEESDGHAAPVRTYEDMLSDAHDAALFTYYATSQLAIVDASSGAVRSIGAPGLIATSQPSPDGRHILIAREHEPYSYLVPEQRFPRTVEVWARDGTVEYRLADLPLADRTPIGGVATGPRDYGWVPTRPATLVWAEALDGGNPRARVPFRDRVRWLAAPFTARPAELFKTEQRFAGLEWGERGDLGIVRDRDQRTATVRTFFFDPTQPNRPPRPIWTLNARDRYHDPGRPATVELANGQRAVAEDGADIFLVGNGASPEGDHPFLDRFNVRTLASERLFRSAPRAYESVVALLAGDGSRLLTRHETASDPPNYFVRAAGGAEARALTHFADPAPAVRQLRSELVTYRRADGVPLSMTVVLPPDYRPGERRPAVLWAYPYEFTNARVAGQVSGSPYRFLTLTGYSQLFLALDGYVVLDNAAMPIIGPPRTVNDTFVPQLVADAQAAIAKAAAMGVIDAKRVAVAGHSYGAFMTANLLAHSTLFRAGCAQSGAYNRTLTPFGFQNERRTFWQAEATYEAVSPFFYADKIKAPLLLIHGMADNNSGTFPIQSKRLYEAVEGNGGTVRYVQLPYEPHGYQARQTAEDVLWEMIQWFDRYVKNAPAGGASAVAGEH